MEYHFGVCIKESFLIKDRYNSIVVLAGDSNDNKLSFFVKIYDINEGELDETKNVKFGSAVFFTSEGENIIDIYDIDSLFNSEYSNLKISNFRLEFNSRYGILKVSLQDKERENVYWPQNLISDVEKELMTSLFKGRIYNNYLSSIREFSAENLKNIIEKEKEEVESYDFEDLVNELKISYYADHFYIKTDKPESYNLNVVHSFKGTKYENNEFDTYITRILDLGDRLIGEYDGWFYAEDEARKDVDENTRNIPSIKMNMIRRYSKIEHLDYRVRTKLSNFVLPLFSMLSIPGKILDLKKKTIFNGTNGIIFLNYNNKDAILSDIRNKNSNLRYDKHVTLNNKIYRNVSKEDMLKQWCIPYHDML